MYAIITISLPRINDELIKDEIKAFENYCEDRGYNPTDRIPETCSTKVGRYHIRMEKYIPADDTAKKLIDKIMKEIENEHSRGFKYSKGAGEES